MKKQIFFLSLLLTMLFVSKILWAEENGGLLSIYSPTANDTLSGRVNIQGGWDIPPELKGDIKFVVSVYKGNEILVTQEIPATVKSLINPYVKVMNPLKGSKVSGTVQIEAMPMPDKGYDKVWLGITDPNGGRALEKTFNIGEPIKANWDTTQFKNGRYRLVILMQDKEGNPVIGSSKESEFDIEVMNETPYVQVTSPISPMTAGTMQIEARVAPSDSGYAKVWMGITSSGGQRALEKTFNPGEAIRASWDTAEVKNGRYRLVILLQDKEGNPVIGSSKQSEFDIEVNNQSTYVQVMSPLSPMVTGVVQIEAITVPPGVGYHQAWLGITSQSGGGRILEKTFSLNEPIRASWDTSEVKNGRYRLVILLQDKEGNPVIGSSKQSEIDLEVNNELARVEVVSPRTPMVMGTVEIEARTIPTDKTYHTAWLGVTQDGQRIIEKRFNYGEPIRETWDTTRMKNGQCKLVITLHDKNGDPIIGSSRDSELDIEVNNPSGYQPAP